MVTNFRPFEQKMEREKLSKPAIDTFRVYYNRLAEGEDALIHEKDISPVTSLPELDYIQKNCSDEIKIPETVIIKLNGGLGTTMGMEKAKSLIEAKKGQTFLEIIVKQAEKARQKLMLMESFATFRDSVKMLDRINAPKSVCQFIQNKVPKVLAENLTVADYPKDRDLEWAPPGHGDIYSVLHSSGLLRKLREEGVKYAFISNSDNLGAVMEPAIISYIEKNKIDFLMEVCKREQEDKKGGHLALKRERLILRELAQCPEEDKNYFQDIGKHSYFNTNSIWINLESLAKLLEKNNNILPLPLIFNKKNLNPRDAQSPWVYQIETAMGSAISLFEKSAAIVVSRSRFRPIKTTNDLFLFRSDLYSLRPDYKIERTTKGSLPSIDLDINYYKHIDQLEKHFPKGVPSLKNCLSFKVKGNVTFPATTQLIGDVFVQGSDIAYNFPENSKLTGNIKL